MNVKEKLREDLASLVEKLNMPLVGGITVDYPSNPNHGDYSTNIAMRSVKGKTQTLQPQPPFDPYDEPIDIAKKLVEIFNKKKPDYIERAEAVKPGFINFWLSKEYLLDQLNSVDETFGQGTSVQDKKIMIEFTDPNPFKEFHIGHLYSNTVGEALSRLFEYQGAHVWRVNYQGDIGLHVAKAIWGIQRMINDKGLMIKDLEKQSLKERVEVLGQCYAAGSKAYEENENAKKEINEINKKVYEGQDAKITEIYKKGRQWTLDYFEVIYKRLGTEFKRYYFESEAGPVGLALVKEHLKDGVFKESEGAIIFEGEKYGLHNRVFINSLGLPTYEAKDLGLPPTKYKDFQYDQSIIVTGNEINAYFQVLLKALSLINPDLAEKTHHIGHGMVRLPEGKMSSRTGSIITGEWLLSEAKRRIQKAYPDMTEETAEKVTIGAVKWALLKSGIGRDIAFDFDTSIALEGDSGPYAQYTYARCCSVLQRAGISNFQFPISNSMKNDKWKMENEELVLLRLIHRFPEIVEGAATNLSPNMISSFLFDLAQQFNLFYQKHHVVGSENEAFRLQLTGAVGHTLKNGLHLLGIEAPERM